jgi:predicted Zn-dependent protease
VTQTEDGLATVMGHEVSHALLNHGQQRMSAGVLQELGGAVVSTVTDSSLIMAAYGIGTTLGGTLPFSRNHESEADHYGLILMAIAGYNPEAAVPFWERMSALGGGTIEFLSTHPSSSTRVRQLQGWVPEAKTKAAQLR